MIIHEGDRVRNTVATAYIPEGSTGTSMETSDCPWIYWDNGSTWCRSDRYLELVGDCDGK